MHQQQNRKGGIKNEAPQSGYLSNPKRKKPLYINEPWLIDDSYVWEVQGKSVDPDPEEDNIRVYIPLDLNSKAILRRLHTMIAKYGEANERNESDFSQDVHRLISQIEIYDQIWYMRHMPEKGAHSEEAKQLVREFIQLLEEIPDGCAEVFLIEIIDLLREEYLKD